MIIKVKKLCSFCFRNCQILAEILRHSESLSFEVKTYSSSWPVHRDPDLWEGNEEPFYSGVGSSGDSEEFDHGCFFTHIILRFPSY